MLIHHTFAPLADADQRGLAFKRTWMPWRYCDDRDVKALENALGNAYKGEVITFGSGRESLLALLRALKLQTGEEVIVQGYTCVVVPNAIHAAGMVCVYADIDRETLNLNIEAVEAAITPKTRAIICQHTFGIPADTAKLRDICDRHSLILIEDCAHVLPDEKGPQAIGKLGDAMLMSFGRDKAISGVSGGAMLTRDPIIAIELRQMQEHATNVSLFSIFAFLQYPLVYGIARPLYSIGIGKVMLYLASKCKLLIPILTHGEKEGSMPSTLHRMPGACAALALQQFRKLETINDHRRALTKLYLDYGTKHQWPVLIAVTDDLPLQKFPLFIKNADSIRRTLKKQNIHLSDGWTGCVICPATVDPEAIGYNEGSDPTAEALCEQILSFPTHPGTTQAEAEKLCTLFDELVTSN